MWYLVVYPALQLHDLVLHADVEFLEVFHRTRFDLEFLEFSLGSHAADAALQVNDGCERPLVPLPCQPAPDHLLYDDGLMLTQKLNKHTTPHDEQEKTNKHTQELRRMQCKVEISPVSVLKSLFSLTPSAFLICRYYTSCCDNPLLINRVLTAGKERRETVRVIIQPQLLWSVSGTVPTLEQPAPCEIT